MHREMFKHCSQQCFIILFLVAAFWLAFLCQRFLILPIQKVFIPDSAFPMISLLHGVRVIAAWQFGWWSVLLLAPNAVLLAILFYSKILNTLSFEFFAFFGLSIVYLCSAPLAFSLIGKVKGTSCTQKPFDWKHLMLAGLISAAINVFCQTVLFLPDFGPYHVSTYMLIFVGTMVLGLFCTLLLLLYALRLVARITVS